MRMASIVRNAALLIAVTCIPVVGQQSSGYLKTSVNPGRAGVFIDGKYVGRPAILALAGNIRSLPANMKSSCPSPVTKMW